MANDHKNLAKEIVASYETRVRVIKDIIQDTHKMLESFKKKREQMSKQLRKTLSKSESLRKTDFNKMMADILATQLKREKNVKQMLTDFQKEEEEVAARLRKLLEKGENIRIKDFKNMLAKIKQEQQKQEQATSLGVGDQLERMQAEVHGMLAAFKQEREKIACEWKKVLPNIQNN